MLEKNTLEIKKLGKAKECTEYQQGTRISLDVRCRLSFFLRNLRYSCKSKVADVGKF